MLDALYWSGCTPDNQMDNSASLVSLWLQVAHDIDAIIPRTDYINFPKDPTTLFGRESEGLSYKDSELLKDSSEDHQRALSAANEICPRDMFWNKPFRWWQSYLSAYLKEPVELKHVILSKNELGFAVYSLWYRIDPEWQTTKD